MTLTSCQRSVWQYMIHKLKTNFSPGVPVTVRTVRLKRSAADCLGIMKLGRMVKIVIRVSDTEPWKARIDCLIHEWAHAMEWEANWTLEGPKKEHGETWGVWYAKIYRHLIDECHDDMVRRGFREDI